MWHNDFWQHSVGALVKSLSSLGQGFCLTQGHGLMNNRIIFPSLHFREGMHGRVFVLRDEKPSPSQLLLRLKGKGVKSFFFSIAYKTLLT
jgi:hypothetical protein